MAMPPMAVTNGGSSADVVIDGEGEGEGESEGEGARARARARRERTKAVINFGKIKYYVVLELPTEVS